MGEYGLLDRSNSEADACRLEQLTVFVVLILGITPFLPCGLTFFSFFFPSVLVRVGF
jgi:hypothetical protein